MTRKTKLTKKDVLHVSHLARLSLTDEEIETYTKQLEDVVEHFRELDEVDVSGVESTTHPIDLENVTFEDGIPSKQQLTDLKHLHTKTVNGKTYFVVDRVL